MVQMTAWSQVHVMTEVSEELICTVVARRVCGGQLKALETAMATVGQLGVDD